MNKKKMIDNLNKFYNSREEVINFFRDYIETLSDANYSARQDETKWMGLKVLSPKGYQKVTNSFKGYQ